MAGNKGSNDLNAWLKAEVVKLKVELDKKGSNLPKQVKEISAMLEKHPVKLKVQLNLTLEDLNKQIKEVSKTLQHSKSFKPLKIGVEIDVRGSAKNIKEQLKDVYDTVDKFNRKYGEQLRRMKSQSEQTSKYMSGFGGTNIPTNAGIQNFNNIKRYTEQLKQAEANLRSKFSDGKGLFSSFESKDAQGNLRGFIATLERADGVVEKISHKWNQDKNLFEVVDRNTATNVEKNLKRSTDALKDLQREIDKTGDEAHKFQKEYDKLMRESDKGNLTKDMVQDFKTRLKDEQAIVQATIRENAMLREQEQLIAKINRERAKMGGAEQGRELTSLKRSVSSLSSNDFKNPETTSVLNQMKQQFDQITQEYNDQIRKEKELGNVVEKRKDIFNEILLLQRKIDTSNRIGTLSDKNLDEIKSMSKTIRTMEDYIKVRKRMNEVDREVKKVRIDDQVSKQLDKLRTSMIKWADQTGKSTATVEKRFEQIKRSVGNNIAQITAETERWQKRLADFTLNSQLERKANSVVSGVNHNDIAGFVKDRDVDNLKSAVSELEKMNVATMKMATNSKGVTRITATMEGVGKTVKQTVYEIDELDGKLRHIGENEVFNRNANLGMFEQLRIAMERVPVWMTAMTAFYGSVEGVRAMTQEILKLDSAMTELKRVASDALNPEALLQGAIDMSHELGNNVHEVMASVNELARTFGNFNERQLLAITRTATLMSNVSDLTAEEATNSLVGTMNAFNISAEESIHIVDALNEVDNNYAISTKQLAEGLSKSASVSKTFGVTLEENIGNITAIGAVTMESGRIIGNSLKTIYSRITTLAGAENALASVNIAIKDQEGNMKNVNDILKELGGKWTSLNAEQKQYVAVQVAGREHLARFTALMNNYEMALESTSTAVNSQGSAMRENAEYMKSFEARLNQLKTTFTEFSKTVGEAVLSGGMLMVIEGLIGMAEAGAKVVETFGALPPLFLILGGLASKLGFFSKLKDTMRGSIEDVQTFSREYKRAMNETGNTSRVNAFKTAWQGVTVATDGATTATKRFGFSLKTALVETGIGAIIVGLGIAIEKLVAKYQEHKAVQEQLEAMNKKMVDSYRATGDGMESMIDRYEELSKQQSLTSEEQAELNGLTKAFAEQIPTTVKYVDANGKAHLKNAEGIRKEVEAVGDLSRAQAKLTEAKFEINMEKQYKSYTKVVDKIKELKKEREKLEAEDGKEQTVKAMDGATAKFTPDNSKAIQQNVVETMMAEAQKTKLIQGTIKAIQTQTLAYFEANGKLKSMGEAQRGVVEQFIASNEEMIRFAKDTPEAFEQAYTDLYKVGEMVGNTFADAYQNMSNAMGDDPIKAKEIKNQLDTIASSLPDTFFQMTDEFGNMTKTSETLNDQLEEVINVGASIGAGNQNFEQLSNYLQMAGLSADEAGDYITNLARVSDNGKLQAEGLAKGYDGVADSAENMAEKTMEAIDMTKELFGYTSGDLSGIEQRIQLLNIQMDAQGEAYKSTQQYSDIMMELSEKLQMTESDILANRDSLLKMVDVLQNVDFSTMKTGETYSEFIDKLEGVDSKTKEMLKTYLESGGSTDILNGHQREVVKASQEVEEQAGKTSDAIVDVFSPDYGSNTVDFSQVKGSLSYVEGQAKTTKGAVDTATGAVGNFKNTASQGGNSPFLSTFENQLALMNQNLDLSNGKVQGVKGALEDQLAYGWMQTAQTQAQFAGTKMDETKGKAQGLKGTLEAPVSGGFTSQVEQQMSQTGAKADETSGKVSNLKNTITTGGGNSAVVANTQQQLGTFGQTVDGSFDKFSNFKSLLSIQAQPITTSWGAVNQSVQGVNQTMGTASETAKTVQTNVQGAVQSATGVGQVNKELQSVSDKAKSVAKALSSLDSKLNSVGKDFSLGRTSRIIEGVGDSAENVKDKVNSFSKSLNKINDNAKAGAINKYAEAIRGLSSALGNIGNSATKTASSQQKIVSSFQKVITQSKAYSTSIQNLGKNVGTSYTRMTSSISKATDSIIRSYKKNKSALQDMVKTADKYLKEMAKKFDSGSKLVVKKVETMGDKMNKEFKKSAKELSKTAGQIPKDIADGIGKNMSDASSKLDDLAKDMVKRFKKELGIHSPSRVFTKLGGHVIEGLVNGLSGANLKSLGKDVFDDFGGGVFDSWDMIKAYVSGDFSNIAGGGSASSWKPMIMAAAKQMGETLTEREINGIIAQIQRESGGNQAIVQSSAVWDINTANGNPARGLLQYIPQTFNAYKVPGHSNIYSGYDQLLAFFNNTSWRRDLPYGTRGWGPRGGRKFAKGGFITNRLDNVTVGERGQEVIIPLEQYKARALGLWTQTGQKLGVDEQLLKVMKASAKRGMGGRGGTAGAMGSFGASAGEGGSGGEGGSAGSGSSGVMQQSIYASGYNVDGSYSVHALADTSTEKAELYKVDVYGRQASAWEGKISLLQAQMESMSKTTLKYRDAIKSLISYQTELNKVQQKDLEQAKKRQGEIEKRLKALSNTSKHTVAQREEYNNLQQELETVTSKISSLNVEITNRVRENAEKSLEIFTDYIGQITREYDAYIDGFDKRIDDIQFKIDVRNIVNPDDMKWLLNDQIDIATLAKQKQATAYNKMNSMNIQEANATKKYGYHSEQATAVRAERDSAREAYEEATLAVLNAEKDIDDTRAKIADEGIDRLKDYYNNMKSMATDAIEVEKAELQKAHDAKMEMYDEEIEKVNSVYDEKIKAMDAEKNAEEYNEQLAEKNAKKAELVNKIALLSRDNTVEGRKKVADLQSQLTDLNKEISDFQADKRDEELRKQLEAQKQAQLDELNAKKETEDQTLTDQLAVLDEEKEAITKKYDDLINNDQRWATVRDEAIKGSFTKLNTELTSMQTTLTNMNKGIFDSLTSGFSSYSKTVQDEIRKANELVVDNMVYANAEPVNNAQEASQAKPYTTNSDGTVKTKGSKVEDPKQTTPPAPSKPSTSKPAPSKPSTSTGTSYKKFTTTLKRGSKGENVKTLQKLLGVKQDGIFGSATYNALVKWQKSHGLSADGIAGKNTLTKMGLYGSGSTSSQSSSTSASSSSSSDRKTTSAVNMRKSAGYGNNILTTLPKGAKVQYIGMEKGWAKIKYNGKTGYVGSQFLQKFDTGGYTGDWTGNDGKVAMLHKKEQIFNEDDTSKLYNAVKLLDKITSIAPDISKGNIASKIATAGSIVNITYGDINVTVQDGNKKKAKDIATEILTGMKKKGK